MPSVCRAAPAEAALPRPHAECFGSIGTDTGGSIASRPRFAAALASSRPTGRYRATACVRARRSTKSARWVKPCATRRRCHIAGHDPRDSTSVPADVLDYAAGLGGTLSANCLPKEYLGEGIDPEVRAAFEAAVKQYEALGARSRRLACPCRYGATYYILATAEASANPHGSTAYVTATASRATIRLRSIATHRRRLWRRGETPDILHVRAEQRLLRRVLHQGAKRRIPSATSIGRSKKSTHSSRRPCRTRRSRPVKNRRPPGKMYLSDIYTISCNLPAHGYQCPVWIHQRSQVAVAAVVGNRSANRNCSRSPTPTNSRPRGTTKGPL